MKTERFFFFYLLELNKTIPKYFLSSYSLYDRKHVPKCTCVGDVNMTCSTLNCEMVLVYQYNMSGLLMLNCINELNVSCSG